MKKLIILFLSGFLSFVFANIGKISVAKGEVTVIRNNTNLQASNNFILEKSDQIKTGADGKAQLIFTDNTLITVGAKSTLNVSEYIFDEQNQKAEANFNVVEGTFRTITGKIGKTNPDKFKLQTKSASIGIRGTIFGGDENKLFCEDGQIAVNSNGVEVILNKDQIIEVSQTTPPSTPRTATKQEKEAVKESSGSNDPEMQQNEQKVVEQKNSDTTGNQETKQEESNTQEQTNSETTAGEEGSFEATPTPQETPKVVNVDNIVKNVEDTKASNNDATKQNTLVTKEEKPIILPIVAKPVVSQPVVTEHHSDESQEEPFTFSTYTTQEGLEFEYVTKQDIYFSNTNVYNPQFQIRPTHFTSSQALAQLEYKTAPYSSWINLGEITLYKDTPYSYDELQEVIVPFTGTLADETNNFSFNYTVKIVFDNKGEFFTIHANTIDANFFHHDLGYSGTTPNTSLLLEPTVLHYTPNYLDNEFASNLKTYSENGAGSIGMSGKEYYLNTANNNGYLASYFWDYGQDFTVLQLIIPEEGILSGKSYSNVSWNNSDQMISVQSDLSGSLYGSELQGFAFNVSEGRTYVKEVLESDTFNQINTAYLKERSEITAPTGTATMQGYLQGLGLNIDTSSVLTGIDEFSAPFEFTIDKAAGNFSATGTNYTIETSNESLTSYYVDVSKFGSLFTTMTQGTYDLVSERGWFFTIPDSLNEDDLTYSYDNSDYSSWGYWTASLKDSSNNYLQYTNSSVWVAGELTPSSTIDFLLSTSKPTYTFNGQVLGNVISGGTEITPIDLNDQNFISLTINFSNPSVSGNLGFTADGKSWSANTTTSGVTNSNFTASLEGRLEVDDTTGFLEGKYYGPNLQSVGGKFNLNNTIGNDVASGVFKAKK